MLIFRNVVFFTVMINQLFWCTFYWKFSNNPKKRSQIICGYVRVLYDTLKSIDFACTGGVELQKILATFYLFWRCCLTTVFQLIIVYFQHFIWIMCLFTNPFGNTQRQRVQIAQEVKTKCSVIRISYQKKIIDEKDVGEKNYYYKIPSKESTAKKEKGTTILVNG